MNPFQKDDVVYSQRYGRGIVTRVWEDSTELRFAEHRSIETLGTVSFDPWTPPNHKRPRKYGWWLMSWQSNGPVKHYVTCWLDSKGLSKTPRSRGTVEGPDNYTFLKHLSDTEEIEGEQS